MIAKKYKLPLAASLLLLPVVFAGAVSVTLASWSLANQARVTITASQFHVQYSVDKGSTYSSLSTPLTVPISSSFLPGTIQYVSATFRTFEESTPGTVSIPTADLRLTEQQVYQAFQYAAVQTAGTCSQNDFKATSTYLVGGYQVYKALDSVPDAAAKLSLAGSLSGSFGVSQTACFAIQLSPNAQNSIQGKSLNISWIFSARST